MLTPDVDLGGPRTPSALNARLVALGLVGLTAAVAVLSVPAQSTEPELFTQWLFSYSCGPLKRALVGDILTRFVFSDTRPISVVAMHVVATAVSVATAMLYGLFAARVWMARAIAPPTQRAQMLVAVALLSLTPVGAMYYAGARQYPEVSNLLVLALFSHLLLARPPHTWLLATAALVSLASTLIHESSLLSTIPVILALAVMHAPNGRSRQTAITVGAATFAVCTALVMYLPQRREDHDG